MANLFRAEEIDCRRRGEDCCPGEESGELSACRPAWVEVPIKSRVEHSVQTLNRLQITCTMGDMSLSFLKPRLTNVLLTLVIFSLPLLRERAVFPEGGYEIVYYRPIFLLTAYLQMQDFQPLFLMVGLLLVIYLAVSVVVAIVSKMSKKKGK